MQEIPQVSNNFTTQQNIKEFKQLIESTSADFVIQMENNELDHTRIDKNLKYFLKNFLILLFDLKSDETQVEGAFERPRTLFNALSNLRVFVATKIEILPAKRIFNLLASKYVKRHEGFNSQEEDSSDSDHIYGKKSPQNKKKPSRTNPMKQETNLPELLMLLDQRRKQVEELQLRLQTREQCIQDMTIGYFKDVQHLREMYLRQNENPEQDIYEVTFYDLKQVVDPEIRSFIEKQVQMANESYRLKIRNYEWRNKVLQTELDQLQRTVNILLQKVDLQQVVKTVFTLEKDKYKVWRAFQDCVGNESLFKIFEEQKGGYGIDFRQIDQIISSSQASARIFQRYKEIMEDQILELITRVGCVVSNLSRDNQDKEIQIQSLKEQLESEITQAKRDTKALMEQQFKERENFLKKQYEKQRVQMIKSWISVDHENLIQKNITRYALLKWRMHAKFLQIYPLFQKYTKQSSEAVLSKLDYFDYKEVRNHILKNLLQPPNFLEGQSNETSLNQQIEELYSELRFTMEETSEITLERNSLRKLCTQMEVRAIKNKHDTGMAQKTFMNMQHIIDQMEHSFRLFDKCFQAILNRLGFRNQNYIGLKNMQGILYQTTAPDLADFISRLQKVNIDDMTTLEAINNIYLKTQLAYNKIVQRPLCIDSYTITDVCNLNHSLSWVEAIILEDRKELLIQPTHQPKSKAKRTNEISSFQTKDTDPSKLKAQTSIKEITQESQSQDDEGEDEYEGSERMHIKKSIDIFTNSKISSRKSKKFNRTSSIEPLPSIKVKSQNPVSARRDSQIAVDIHYVNPYRPSISQTNTTPTSLLKSSIKIKFDDDQQTPQRLKNKYQEIQKISSSNPVTIILGEDQEKITTSIAKNYNFNFDNCTQIAKTVRNIGTQAGQSYIPKPRCRTTDLINPQPDNTFLTGNIGITNASTIMQNVSPLSNDLENKQSRKLQIQKSRNKSVGLAYLLTKQNKDHKKKKGISLDPQDKNKDLIDQSLVRYLEISIQEGIIILKIQVNSEKKKIQKTSLITKRDQYQGQYVYHKKNPSHLQDDVQILRFRALASTLSRTLPYTSLSPNFIQELQ